MRRKREWGVRGESSKTRDRDFKIYINSPPHTHTHTHTHKQTQNYESFMHVDKSINQFFFLIRDAMPRNLPFCPIFLHYMSVHLCTLGMYTILLSCDWLGYKMREFSKKMFVRILKKCKNIIEEAVTYH